MKVCSKCKEEKSLDGFYKDKSTKDGYNYKCKDCRRKADQDRRESDPVWHIRRKLQNSLYHENNREKIAARKKEWFSSDVGKLSMAKSGKRWRKKNSHKKRAQDLVYLAVKRGEIIPKEKCEACKSMKKIEAHHPDYKEPLQVLWLCNRCHIRLHRYRSSDINNQKEV